MQENAPTSPNLDTRAGSVPRRNIDDRVQPVCGELAIVPGADNPLAHDATLDGARQSTQFPAIKFAVTKQ
jgi:hypothetical protein